MFHRPRLGEHDYDLHHKYLTRHSRWIDFHWSLGASLPEVGQFSANKMVQFVAFESTCRIGQDFVWMRLSSLRLNASVRMNSSEMVCSVAYRQLWANIDKMRVVFEFRWLHGYFLKISFGICFDDTNGLYNKRSQYGAVHEWRIQCKFTKTLCHLCFVMLPRYYTKILNFT